MHSQAHGAAVFPSRRWDIFCQVIDNYGDAGVCWRLAQTLQQRGQRVRLWMDDASILEWLIDGGLQAAETKHGVEVRTWPRQPEDFQALAHLDWGDVLVEAFGCEIPPECLQALVKQCADSKPPCWINLEYLSAESYVERCHRLPSPLMSGPAAGWTRWFFYPGFTPATGGLLRSLPEAVPEALPSGLHCIASEAPCFTLFCYEPQALAVLMHQWLVQWQSDPVQAPHWRVMAGRSQAAVLAVVERFGTQWPAEAMTWWHFLPFMPQSQFDAVLHASQFNLVRGEDSLVQALWAGAPLVWHIYPQNDNAHHDKLDAFLDWLQAPSSLRSFHYAWNGMGPADALPALTPQTLVEWRHCIEAARKKLLAQTDLATQLLGFVQEKS